MGIENVPDASDFMNLRDAAIAQLGYVARNILFRKFMGYNFTGTGMERFRTATYAERGETVWLSQIKAFDVSRGGRFTTGDLDVYSIFQIQGFSASIDLPNDTQVGEYGGDQIIWNGKLWVVADQVEPVPFGPMTEAIFYRTVLRHADRRGQGVTPGVG